MVYCGRPSKACEECRSRRTKCDYLKPNCSQCIRMGRICTGYRDPVDAMFRDESKDYGAKRQRVKRPKKAPPPSSHKTCREIDQAFAACSIAFISAPNSTLDQTCESPHPRGSDISNKEQGACFSFKNDILDQQNFDGCNFSEISDKYRSEVRDAVIESLMSLGGVVGVSKSWNTTDTMVNTQIKYNMAFIDRFCGGDEANEDFAGLDLSPEISPEDKGCPELDEMFDFDCFTDEVSTGFPLPIQDMEYCNKPILAGPADSTDMQALCFFFANYVLEDTAVSKGYLDYLPNLCMNEGGGSFLMDAVTCLGLVGLATRKYAPNALNSAHLKYASALRQLNIALTSGNGALTDQALTTVFLMGLYEQNTCSTPHNIRAWTKHIRGAIAMLQLRGKEQLDSSVGRQVFLQWRSQIITYCHHRRIPIPEFILEWSRGMLQYESPDEAMATTLCLATSKLCALRADMEYFRNYSKSAKAVPWALAIDAELEECASNWPLAYERRSPTSTEHSDFMLGDYFDVYSSVTVATVWNEYRRMRLLCHEIVLQHLPHIQENRAAYPDFIISSQEIEEQLHSSKRLLDNLSQEICASVPFYFGIYVDGGGLKMGTLAPKAVCGNLLLRPLYMAAEPSFISKDVQKWVIGRFEKIAEIMGVKQATAMGHLVTIGMDPDQWENTIQD